MFKQIKLLFILFCTAAAFVLPQAVTAKEVFPEPFVSEEDPTGKDTGIYLPSDTTEYELSAALLLRAELGTKTWQEDDLLMGTFDALSKEGRKNRILVAQYDDLPEEAKKRLPEEEKPLKDHPVVYEYEEDGRVLVVTAKEKEKLSEAVASLISLQEEPEEEAHVPKAELDLLLWPYPFRTGTRFQPLAVVFPEEILDTELNLLGRVLAMKAEDIPTEIDLKIVRSSQNDKCFGRNLIIVGTGDNNEFLNTLLTEEEKISDRGLLRLTQLAQEQNNETSDVTALLLYGKDEETLSYVLRYLRNEENVSRMTGDALLVDAEMNAEFLHTKEDTGTEAETETVEGTKPQGSRDLALGVCLVAMGAVGFGCIFLIRNSIRDRRHGG